MSLATWLVTLYPREWRRRYEEEMLAVLEQHHVTLLTVLDLLFGMIRARLDPQYRDDPGLVLFTSLPRATWIALAAWGAFVVCVDVMSGPLYFGMIVILTGHRNIPVPGFGDSFLAGVGNAQLGAIAQVVGGNLWYYDPAIVVLPFFAITALVCLGCLRWAARTRHVGIILVTMVWFALPVGAILWLATKAHDLPINQYMFHIPLDWELGAVPIPPDISILLPLSRFSISPPVSLLTALGETEALMGLVFLSVLRAGQAIRARRYRLLALVAGVDAALAMIAVYIVNSWNLFVSIGPPRYTEDFFIIEALGLMALLLPFAAIGLPLLAVVGNAFSQQQWRLAVLGVSLLSLLMAVCDVCFIVGVLVNSWQYDVGMSSLPVLWNQVGMVELSIPGEAILATLVLSVLVALGALRSMAVAGSIAAPAPSTPA